MKRIALLIVLGCASAVMWGRPLSAEDLPAFPQEQVLTGSTLYSRYCSVCHGAHMQNPDDEIGAFDLRQFPRDQHDRFVASVTRGKNSMPPWGDRIKPADIEALWAYVCAGEK